MKTRLSLLIFPLFALAMIFANLNPTVRSQQTPAVAYVKQFDDGSYLVSIDGVDHWAVDLAKTKELKGNEIKLQAAATELVKLNDSLTRSQANVAREKQNVQDERIEKAKIHTMYDDQVKLSTECFTLLKRGGGRVGKFLDNPWVRLGKEIGVPVAQIATCK
jgi:hypothetical protein